MNTTWVKPHRLFVIALLIALAHFVLISAIGHYIAVQVGTQVGHVVTGGLVEAYEKSPQDFQKSEEEGKRIYQDMKNRSEGIIENWRLPLLLISLPIKPLINPFLKDITYTRMKMVLSGEISKDQFYKWGIIIDRIANIINSLFVGFLTYVVGRVARHYEMKT